MSGFLDLSKVIPGPRRRVWQARYDDTCGRCLQDILQGQDIVMHPDDGTIHFSCREEEDGDT